MSWALLMITTAGTQVPVANPAYGARTVRGAASKLASGPSAAVLHVGIQPTLHL